VKPFPANPLALSLLIILLTGLSGFAQVIEGTVFEDHSGAPLQAALVRVSGADGVVLREAESGRDGRFLVEGLAAGEYFLAITKANFMRLEVRASARSARVPDGAPSSVFRLIRYGVLAGRVVPAQTGGVVLIERIADGMVPRTSVASTNRDGEYRFFNIAPGRYVLGKTTISGGTAAQRGLVLHPNNNRPREFTFYGGEEYLNEDVQVPQGPSFAIAGRVQQPPAGTNSSHMVLLVSPDYPTLRIANSPASAATGVFRFENMLPGTYDLLVSGFAPREGVPAQFGRTQVSVISQDLEDIVLTMEAARTAEIVVQTRQESCSTDGVVSLTPLELWLSMQTRGVPFSTPTLTRVEGLPPARYRVSARSSRGDCTAASILDLRPMSPATLALTLTPAAEIRGRVTAAGSPLPVNVVLRDLEEARESPVRAVLTRSGVDFTFGNLSPGRYCIAAYLETDAVSRWVPQTGCYGSPLDLAPGAREIVELKR
jgi:hypothetical protein